MNSHFQIYFSIYVFLLPIHIYAQCEISDISLLSAQCDSNHLEIELDFISNQNQGSFTVAINGNDYGPYPYEDKPLEFSNIMANDSILNISVCDNEINGCCTELEIINPCICFVGEIEAVHSECDSSGSFEVNISFESIRSDSSLFVIRGNGMIYDTFEYGDPFYTVGPLNGDCETIFEFLVIDLEYESCMSYIEFEEPICCEEEELCRIWDIEVDPIECTGNGIYSLELDFLFQNNTNSFFDVIVNGQNIGFFQYAQLPVFIEEFPERMADYDIITICDNDNPDCCETFEFMGLDCFENDQDCNISNLIIEHYECDENNQFLVDIAFDYSNNLSNSFIIRGNGTIYDTFQYGDPFYTVGPLDGDCETIYEFIIIDLEADSCAAFAGFEEPICCEEEELCRIWDIEVDPIECTGDGIYSLELDFLFQNNTNSFFDVIVNGQNIGFFQYAQLPVFIEEFPERMADYDIITICDNDNPDCCETFEFMGLDCFENDQDCNISNLIIEHYECDENNQFLVDIAFDYSNNLSNSFIIRGNGTIYDTFQYGDPFYTVGPLDGDCETIYEFIIIDLEADSCAAFTGFEEPICCEEEELCRIWDIEVDPIECTGDGIYSLELDFLFQNNTNSFFDVIVNGQNIGFFQYAQLPVFIEEFPERMADYDIITICDNDNPDCCETFEFMGLDCFENDQDCNISNLIIEQYECDENNQFLVDIAFDYSNNLSNSFIIRGNGTIYDTFQYGDPFYTVGPLDGDCETIYEFIIIDLEADSCAAFTGFEEPICCDTNSSQESKAHKYMIKDHGQISIVHFLDSKISAVQLIDLNGQLLKNERFDNSGVEQVFIDKTNVPNGVYLLKLEVSAESLSILVPLFH